MYVVMHHLNFVLSCLLGFPSLDSTEWGRKEQEGKIEEWEVVEENCSPFWGCEKLRHVVGYG
jgi:hypothetical protein